jgi:hypothetical protein
LPLLFRGLYRESPEIIPNPYVSEKARWIFVEVKKGL